MDHNMTSPRCITDNHDKENSRIVNEQFTNLVERKLAMQTECTNILVNPLSEVTEDYNPCNKIRTKRAKPRAVVNGKRAKNRMSEMDKVSALLYSKPDPMEEKTKKLNVLTKIMRDQRSGISTIFDLENVEYESSLNSLKDHILGGVAEFRMLMNGRSLKKQPEKLCECPSKCNDRIGVEWRRNLYQQFHGIEDHSRQNQFIQRHIKIKSLPKRSSSGEILRAQRRVTCKYIVPMSGSINDSYSYAKSLSYDTVKSSLYSSSDEETAKESLNKPKPTAEDDSTEAIQTDLPSIRTSTLPSVNGHPDPALDVDSPMSFNDSDSVGTSFDDGNDSDGENRATKSVKYIEVCLKTFMNMFGLSEKRIRHQREGLIDRSRKLAEEKQKEREETERTLDLARILGAGCQPLYALLEETNCLHLCSQLLSAIEADVALVDDFFSDTLWNPEVLRNESVRLSSSEQDAHELVDCD